MASRRNSIRPRLGRSLFKEWPYNHRAFAKSKSKPRIWYYANAPVPENPASTSFGIDVAILEELQTNPLLEEIGTNDESLDSTENEASPDEIEENESDEFNSEKNESEDSTKEEKDEDFDIESNGEENIEDMDFSDEFAILREMQEDLKEHYEREYEGEAQLGNSDAEEKRKFFFDSLVVDFLQEHLLISLN